MRGIQWLVTWGRESSTTSDTSAKTAFWVQLAWTEQCVLNSLSHDCSAVCVMGNTDLFNWLLVVDWINYANNVGLWKQSLVLTGDTCQKCRGLKRLKWHQPLIFLGKVVLLTAQLLEGAKPHLSTSFKPFCLTLRVKKGCFFFVVRATCCWYKSTWVVYNVRGHPLWGDICWDGDLLSSQGNLKGVSKCKGGP